MLCTIWGSCGFCKRSVMTPTWTSGEPGWLCSRALSWLPSAWLSKVTDIVTFPRTSLLQIEAEDDLERSRQSLDQVNGTHVAVPSPIEPVIRAYPGPDATLTDRPCRFRGKVQSRDVAQPCLERQKSFCLGGP